MSLFSVCPRTPRLLLCLADEVGGELFGRDIELALPVARLAPARHAPPSAETEEIERLAEPDALQIFWAPAAPATDSLERVLFERLRAHGLWLEPFERAATGLREVYSQEIEETP